MRRIITICALCATAFAGASALAMPLGVRTLLHAHAAARQAETPSQPQPGTPQPTWAENDGWTLQADGSWKSPATPDDGASSVSMAVTGAGTVTFRWKTSCEDYFNFKGTLLRQDALVFLIDGVEMAVANGIMSDWAECSFTVDGAGNHTFTWSYMKDPSGADGEDCAWIDAVVWSPSGVSVGVGGGKTVLVPGDWLAAHEGILQESGGDAVAALQAPAVNKRLTVAQCYILGLDPEEPESDFRIVSFPMGTDGKPDISKIEFEPDEGEWNVSGARAVLKGAPSLGDATWKAVEGASDDEKAAFRYFKVEVELP